MSELSNEVVVELTEESIADFATEARRSWIKDQEQQERDLQSARSLSIGIVLGCMFWLAIAVACFFLSGCTASISIQPINYEAVDGGSEPIGYGMTREIEEEK